MYSIWQAIHENRIIKTKAFAETKVFIANYTVSGALNTCTIAYQSKL